jgi:hypothetical protein
VKETDHGQRRLLRSRGQRPCNYRAAEKPDEFPPSHGIVSLAENHLLRSLIRSASQYYAPQQNRRVHVRFGSKADIRPDVMSALCQNRP